MDAGRSALSWALYVYHYAVSQKFNQDLQISIVYSLHAYIYLCLSSLPAPSRLHPDKMVSGKAIINIWSPMQSFMDKGMGAC